MTDIEPVLTTVPRDLYYHEVAYVRGLEVEIERLLTENGRLRVALEPFGFNATAVSLSEALGHVTREDLLRARDALK